jgi:hypothetical protein
MIHIGKKITDALGYTAKSYLLSANRPSIGINAYLTPKRKVSLDIGTAFNNNFYEVPVDLEYGISNSVILIAGIPILTQAYKFNGDKVSGLGDAHLGFKFRIQESEHFIHAFQFAVKIPTASKSEELGTGRIDYHFGLAEGYYAGRFSYELTAELNLLRRRDFPDRQFNIVLIQNIVDSIKQYYDYKFEPELAFSFSPAVDIGNNFEIYTGAAYSNNLRLNYDTMQLFAGFGYSLSDKASLSLGYSIEVIRGPGWLASAGLNLIL